MRNVTNQPKQVLPVVCMETDCGQRFASVKASMGHPHMVERDVRSTCTDELSLALEHNQSSAQDRQRMMDQLHALAIADFDQVRTDDQSYNLTREGKDSCDALSTGTLGRLIDPTRITMPNGWVVALVRNDLHGRAAREFQRILQANTSYQMTRTGDPDTAVDIIPTDTLNQWLRKDNVLPLIPWVRAICLDELRGRAVVELAAQSDWSACDCHGRMYRTEDLTDRDGVLQCHQADDNNPLPAGWLRAVMR